MSHVSEKSAIRVLVADDSAATRAVIAQLLSTAEGVEVVGQAEDGVVAVDKVSALRPDVVTMDVVMPRLDGLGATAAIMAQAPTRVLVVCDTTQHTQLDLSFRAMEAGALEVIPKPLRGESTEQWGRRLVEAVRLMADVPVVGRPCAPAAVPQVLAFDRPRPDIIGIVASTGGPPALAGLLGALPGDFPIPILVAQHMAHGFAKGLVRWLDGATRLSVRVASDQEAAASGCVYIPPDGRDLTVDPGGALRTPAPEGVHCPSGNRLLASMAVAFGQRTLGAVLTGMGDDGADGVLQIRRAGGHTLAQDEGSSVVFGMPQAAAATGAVDCVLPLAHFPMKLVQLAVQRGRSSRPISSK